MPSSLQTTAERSDFSSMRGASYSVGKVMFSMTQSRLTLQKSEILSKIDSSRGSSHRSTIMSGLIPMPCSSFTECWVGLDLCSSDPLK